MQDLGMSLTYISQGEAEGQKYCHLCVCVPQAEGRCLAQATHRKRLTTLSEWSFCLGYLVQVLEIMKQRV